MSMVLNCGPPARQAKATALNSPQSVPGLSKNPYTSSNNPFKQIELSKDVVWDCDRITNLLTEHEIEIEFLKSEHMVVAEVSHEGCAFQGYARLCCALSSGAIAWKPKKNRLACEYQMAATADEFYSRTRGTRFAGMWWKGGSKMVFWIFAGKEETQGCFVINYASVDHAL